VQSSIFQELHRARRNGGPTTGADSQAWHTCVQDPGAKERSDVWTDCNLLQGARPRHVGAALQAFELIIKLSSLAFIADVEIHLCIWVTVF
jgi:hypothetical protein